MVGRESYMAVYMMADKRRGTIYVGVTSTFLSRIIKHREGVYEGLPSGTG